jgi:hypothetical protein
LTAPGARSDTDAVAAEIGLPLVSVIITAHNYGRFLPATIASVLSQSYRDIECVVVDDGSTDDTAQVLEAEQSASPSLVVVRNRTPAGQGGASRAGFEASRGQYVVFMDGDDLLTPHFVRDHVYVNLSSRIPVGCTASDIYQIVDHRIVLATGEALNKALLEPSIEGPDAFRPLARAPEGPWPYDGPTPDILAATRYVPPGQTRWRWSPMTANMFRRDALTLITGSKEFEEMRLSTDAFLCTGVSVICGSLLIDRPLSYYRIHGGNQGTYQAQLTNVRTVREDKELSTQAKALLFQYLTREAPAVCGRLWDATPLLAALDALSADLEACGLAQIVAQCLEANRNEMIAGVGEARFSEWTAARAPPVKKPWWSKLTPGKQDG